MAKQASPKFDIPDIAALQEEGGSSEGGPPDDFGGGEIGKTLADHHDRLMAIDGVVMVGQGQDEIGRDAIVVGVKQHHQLKALPKTIAGARVVGMVIGEVDALASTAESGKPGRRKPLRPPPRR